MDLKDNSYRCPWCGNIVEKVSPSRYGRNEKECPYCHHTYICKLRIFPVAVTFLAPFTALVFSDAAYSCLAVWIALIYLFCFDYIRAPMVRHRDRVMPTKGYTVKIKLYSDYWKIKLKYRKIMLENDMITPIIFIDKSGNAVSLPCCARIEDGKWRKGLFECDLKLLEFGEKPEITSDRIYLYNMGKVIGVGEVMEELKASY